MDNFNKNGIKIFHLNINHLLPKLHELEYFLHKFDIDIIFISETFLDKSVNNNFFKY